ncbi:MAG: hydrogenase maturation nickel metallochaperone HypA, partial [Candidatus Thermoplasmatota archaeon]
MHEFSTMCQIVDALLKELKDRDVKSVAEVWLEIGELTFLGTEQLKFAYGALTDNNILKGSKLVIKKVKPLVKCKRCKYKGKI